MYDPYQQMQLSPAARRQAISQLIGNLGASLGGLGAVQDPMAAFGRGVQSSLGGLQDFMRQQYEMERMRAQDERSRQAFAMQQERHQWAGEDREWNYDQRVKALEDEANAYEERRLRGAEMAEEMAEDLERIGSTVGPNHPAFGIMRGGIDMASTGDIEGAQRAWEQARAAEVSETDREDRQAHAQSITAQQQAGRTNRDNTAAAEEIARVTGGDPVQIKAFLDGGGTPNQAFEIYRKKKEETDTMAIKRQIELLERGIDSLRSSRTTSDESAIEEIDAEIAKIEAEILRLSTLSMQNTPGPASPLTQAAGNLSAVMSGPLPASTEKDWGDIWND